MSLPAVTVWIVHQRGGVEDILLGALDESMGSAVTPGEPHDAVVTVVDGERLGSIFRASSPSISFGGQPPIMVP